jgi:hypothetical protein
VERIGLLLPIEIVTGQQKPTFRYRPIVLMQTARMRFVVSTLADLGRGTPFAGKRASRGFGCASRPCFVDLSSR